MPRKVKIGKDGVPDITFERGLPASVEAERSYLGGALLDNRALYEADPVAVNDFALDSHQRIAHCIFELIQDGHVADIVTVAEELHKRKEVQSVGGVAYLSSLLEGLPHHLSIAEYARIIRDKAQLREAINVCSIAITKAADQSGSAEEIIAETDLHLLEISSEQMIEPQPIALAVQNEFDALVAERASGRNTALGIPSGLGPLDDSLDGGFAEGELTIVAGRPGQGKSSLLIQTGCECGLANIPAHIFQLEMTMPQMLRRMLAAIARIYVGKLKHGAVPSKDEMDRIADAKLKIARFPLIIDTNTYLTKQQIFARARISHLRFGTRFFGLDYLQKIRFDSKAEYRNIEVGDTAKLLATFAKNEHVAVVALSSLTENKVSRDAEPTLADLRFSGDIQYECSTCVAIHRKRVENSAKLSRRGKLILLKQRNGDTGSVPVLYNGASVFVADPDEIEEKPTEDKQEEQYKLQM